MDLGGVWIDEGTKLGPRVALITVNHGEAPTERKTLITKSIHIGKKCLARNWCYSASWSDNWREFNCWSSLSSNQGCSTE